MYGRANLLSHKIAVCLISKEKWAQREKCPFKTRLPYLSSKGWGFSAMFCSIRVDSLRDSMPVISKVNYK